MCVAVSDVASLTEAMSSSGSAVAPTAFELREGVHELPATLPVPTGARLRPRPGRGAT